MQDFPATAATRRHLVSGLEYRLKGGFQIYQLQTENDEEETWSDLVCLPTKNPQAQY